MKEDLNSMIKTNNYTRSKYFLLCGEHTKEAFNLLPGFSLNQNNTNQQLYGELKIDNEHIFEVWWSPYVEENKVRICPKSSLAKTPYKIWENIITNDNRKSN